VPSAGTHRKGEPQYLSVSYNMIQGVANCIADSQDRPGFFEVPEARIVFQNGVLDVRTREFRPATAEDCVRAALPFDYHEDQLQRHPPKHWSDFVLAQWGEDAECFNLLHQILGYLLSGRMDLEKMFVFLGPPRCGKGTIIKLLQAIMGDTVGTFKIAALDQTFGMSNMLGKSVLVDPDVRKSKSAFKDTGAIAERLLSITSGDKQAVRLMRQAPIDVVLPGRILVATNPPFEMRDDGGALASRVVVLPFNTSHLGSEDPGLLDRLKAEIPSIVALAMSGLTQLDKQGRFTEPARAADVREDIRQSQDPMIEWFEDHYEAKAMPPGEELLVADVYQHACNWRMGEGLRPFSKRALGGFLSKHNIRSKVERRDGKPQRLYFGLKPKGE
jgi:P4 family phage/plasmid primase-like protien